MKNYRGRNVKRSRKPHGNPKEGKEINSLLAEAPMPLPPVEWEAPHWHPTAQSLHILLFLGSRSHCLLISGLIWPRKRKGETQEWDVQKEKKYIISIYKFMCMHESITIIWEGRGCNTRIVNGSLTTGPCHCLTLWFFLLYFTHNFPEFHLLGRQ